MVTDRQARRLMKELGTGVTLGAAALRSGMSENTARRYRGKALPSQRKLPRAYRTRPDPFAQVWPAIVGLLEEAPGLEAVTIFETLSCREGDSFTQGQLRTLQRKIRRWRATAGPEREVMFAQQHRPGEYGQSDFTSMNELGITIGGERFGHLLYHFVLPYSNWETVGVCFTESFEALIAGLQTALWKLGRAPRIHRTDNLSAATHDLGEAGRVFNDRYVGALGHYGMLADKNTPGRGHENGDVEQAHHRFKRALEQALLVRGNREFNSRTDYEGFVGGLVIARNRRRAVKLQEELARMHDLPLTRLDDFRSERVLVTRFSTIRVAGNIYSVASRLIGEHVDVRLYPDRLEVYYAGERMAEMERLRGKGGASIDYRHLIWSLVRKPGAFARYRWREALFPTLTFRRAFDALESHRASRADVEYVRILHLAASTSQTDVEAVLTRLLENDDLRDYAQVRDAVRPEPIATPMVEIAPVCLEAYDACLTAGGAL